MSVILLQDDNTYCKIVIDDVALCLLTLKLPGPAAGVDGSLTVTIA